MGPSYDMHWMDIENRVEEHTNPEPLWTFPPITAKFRIGGAVVALLFVAVII